MDRETIQLILDMGGSAASVDEVIARLATLKGTVATTADSYEVLSTVVNKSVGGAGSYEIATDKVNVALDEEVRKAAELTHAQRALAAALRETEGPTYQATAALTALAGQKGAGGGAMGAAYGLQDVITVLSMGGGWSQAMMSATNNITPMLIGLGLGGGLAGMAGLAITAIVAMGPALNKMGLSLDTASREKIPQATDQVERLTRSIKEDREAIEELTKKRELDFLEMEKYTLLVAKLDREEEELKRHREARSVGAGQEKAVRERGAAFREAVAEYGGGDKLVRNLSALGGYSEKEAEELVIRAQEGMRGSIDRIIAELHGKGSAEFGYISPEDRRAAQTKREQTDRILAANARKAAEAQAAQEKARKAEELASTKNAAEEKKEQEHLNHEARLTGPEERRMRGTMKDTIREMQMQEATRRQIQAASGEAPRGNDRHLAKLQGALGAEMPSVEEALTMQQMAMAQMVSNQATMAQRLKQARALLEQSRKVGEQVQQPLMNGGWN